MSGMSVFTGLAEDYPLLYLDPDRDSQETYREVVLRGDSPQTASLAHYRGDPHDRDEMTETPAGKVRVVTLGDRHDFELVIRGMSAAKSGPLAPVPESQGAATLTVFNWPRIHAHLAGYPEEERSAEFRRFTAVKENYLDRLVVLSRGAYSNVSASEVGCGKNEWLVLSDTIRRYHELTHVICRRMYPDHTDAVRDELIADAVGIYAAYGSFEPEKEKLFLGLKDGRYSGGRLENYTDQPEKLSGSILAAVDRMKELMSRMAGAPPFDLIPPLMAIHHADAE